MKLAKGFSTETAAAGTNAAIFYGYIRSNEIAAFIAGLLERETTEGAICDAVVREYGVSRRSVQRDVARVLSRMRELGAIER